MRRTVPDRDRMTIESVIARGPRTPDLGGQARTEDVGRAIAELVKEL